jgi:thioredoxin reductase
MHTWMTQMPKGMRLKSEGFASSLYDPESAFTLEQYCREQNIPYADTGLPVPIETFIAYGLEFQKRFAPELEDKLIVSVERAGSGFRVILDDGEKLDVEKVVIAVGISHFANVPSILSDLTKDYASHSSLHNEPGVFKGREVAVVGAGASALDLAALLDQAGASVQLIARKPAIRFHDPPKLKPRTLRERISAPMTGIGPGWKLYFCANTPWAFRHLSQSYRLKAVKKILGPAPGWFIKDQVVGKMPFHLGFTITEAKVQDGKVQLDIADSSGTHKTLTVDHVIAATGYKVALRRLKFLSSGLLSDLRTVEETPVLSSHFESSIPGLYFVGTSAANTFGPLMRFAFGAGFAARRLSAHLEKSASHKAVLGKSPVNIETVSGEVAAR